MSDVITTDRKYRYRFATGGKLILFKHILLSRSILLNNRVITVIVVEIKQKIFELRLQLLTFENFHLQLHQNCVINCNFVNYKIRID